MNVRIVEGVVLSFLDILGRTVEGFNAGGLLGLAVDLVSERGTSEGLGLEATLIVIVGFPKRTD
jgi:hypothetical protein